MTPKKQCHQNFTKGYRERAERSVPRTSVVRGASSGEAIRSFGEVISCGSLNRYSNFVQMCIAKYIPLGNQFQLTARFAQNVHEASAVLFYQVEALRKVSRDREHLR